MPPSYIQAGASTSLNGREGFQGWQWTFLIDGIVSIFIIICQFVSLPDILSRTKPNRFLSEHDLQWLQTRKPPLKTEPEPESRLAILKEQLGWLKQWRVWAFWGFGISQDIISLSDQSTQFWIKGWNKIKPGSYTTAQYNNLTSPLAAVTFLCAVLFGWTSDTLFKGKRWPGIAISGIWSFIIMIVLATIPVYGSKPIRFFLYYNTGVAQAAAGLYWCYSQELFAHNLRQAAFVAGGINVWAYVANSIVNNIWFKTSKQPFVQTGHFISAFFAVVYTAIALCLGLTQKKYLEHFKIEDVSFLNNKTDNASSENFPLEKKNNEILEHTLIKDKTKI